MNRKPRTTITYKLPARPRHFRRTQRREKLITVVWRGEWRHDSRNPELDAVLADMEAQRIKTARKYPHLNLGGVA